MMYEKQEMERKNNEVHGKYECTAGERKGNRRAVEDRELWNDEVYLLFQSSLRLLGVSRDACIRLCPF